MGAIAIHVADTGATRAGPHGSHPWKPVNGAGAEMLHIWDGNTTLLDAYATLWRQYSMLFEIAAENARNGVRPLGLQAMMALQMRQERLRKCYPPTT